MTAPLPVSVAIVNDYPVVVQGVARILEHDRRVRVVQVGMRDVPHGPVDVLLLDTSAAPNGGMDAVERMVNDPNVGRLVVYTWNVDVTAVSDALRLGARGYLSKALGGRALADAIVRVHNGEQVLDTTAVEQPAVQAWPGREAGLSAREAEVVALIAQGRTNEEIASECYLSINSVKTYIRSAYRKMGVERRSQAVLWGIANGMVPGLSDDETPVRR